MMLKSYSLAQLQQQVFIGLLAGAVGFAGWQGHQAARVEGPRPLADGSYQRQYESTFAGALPGRSLGTEFFAAAKLALLGEMAEGAVMGRDGWLFTTEELMPPKHVYDLAAELQAARGHLDPLGVQLLPVILPDKARVHAAKLPRRRSAPYQQRYPKAQALLAAAGYPVVDSLRALRAEGFMRTDTHWTPAGARAVAAEIAALLPTRDSRDRGDFETVALETAPFDGDLTRFAATGRFGGWAGITPEAIQTYETHSHVVQDLFGDVEIPVVLVGSSFSANPAFHFEGFLKSALGQDVLNMAQVGRGPFAPMHAYLGSEELRENPPEIVIWEIPERYLSLEPSPAQMPSLKISHTQNSQGD